MKITREECQACPYKIRHESFAVICFPCMREVIREMESREEKKENAAGRGCFCMRGIRP